MMFFGVWILATIFTGPFGLIGWPLVYFAPHLLREYQPPK